MSTNPCSECSTTDIELSELKGYEHLCLACEAQKTYEELEDQIEKELQIFHSRTGRILTYNEFCYFCGIDIDPEQIKDLPELKLAYETEMAAINEYKNRSRQLELELDDDGLPF